MTQNLESPHRTACRYTLELPTHVEVLLEEIQIPERLRSPDFNPRRMVRLPAAEVFCGPTPRVSFDLLKSLCHGDLVSELLEEPPLPIKASTAARNYRLAESRIELPPEVTAPDNADETADSAAKPYPAALPLEEPAHEQAEKSGSKLPTSTAPLPGAEPISEADRPRKKSMFSGLPIFRRKPVSTEEPSAGGQPSAAVEPSSLPVEQADPATPRAESPMPAPPPAPKATLAPADQVEKPGLEAFSGNASPAPAPHQPAAPSPAMLAPVDPASPSPELSIPVAIKQEAPEPALDIAPPPLAYPDPVRDFTLQPVDEPVRPLACEERLQEIFLTEDPLPIERVVELCGGLPGIRSCILSRETRVVGSHAVPDSLDIVSLTSNGSDLLESLRSSAMKMGLGAVPAMTIHSEKGAVSIFSHGQTSLIVTHSDRGFVPGVRERLSRVVEALDSSELPKTLNSPA